MVNTVCMTLSCVTYHRETPDLRRASGHPPVDCVELRPTSVFLDELMVEQHDTDN